MRVLLVAAVGAAVLLPSVFNGASAREPVFPVKKCFEIQKRAKNQQAAYDSLQKEGRRLLATNKETNKANAIDLFKGSDVFLTEVAKLATIYTAFCKL